MTLADKLNRCKEDSTKIINEHAYLYSCWGGPLRMYEGFICNGLSGLGYFMTETKRFVCSPIPGFVYNAIVWLTEKDEILAKRILIENEKQSIVSLKEKIENHLTKIQLLKGE